MKILKHSIVLILVLLVALSCNNSGNQRGGSSAHHLDLQKFDTSLIALFISDEKGYMIPIEFSKSPLSEDDFLAIESLLSDGIRQYNDQHSYPISLAHRKRQYKYYINESGEKEVWVNCFCKEQSDWRSRQVIDLDSYKCAFDTRINLSQKKCERIFVSAQL